MAQDEPVNSAALGAGLACYLIWGFVPLAFQAIGRLGVGPWEILAHRTLWGAPTALAFVLMARQGRQVLRVFSNPKLLGGLLLSSGLIAANWIVFIWAVNSGRVLESSLGYYITPLINMAAGVLLFRERFDRVGVAAIALAVLGVVIQAVAVGVAPKWPWPWAASHRAKPRLGIARNRHSMNRPVWASAATCLRTRP